jgi:hypothetical protein
MDLQHTGPPLMRESLRARSKPLARSDRLFEARVSSSSDAALVDVAR